MKVAICEPDIRIRECVRKQLLQELSARYHSFSIESYSDGFSLIDGACHDDNYDLYFINASMHGLSGIELAREVKKYRDNSLLVLYAASDKYAMAAWDMEAFFYLMLPPTQKDTARIIAKAERQLRERDSRYVRIKMKDGWYHILLRNILYCESNAHKVTIYMADGTIFTTYGKLDDFETAMNQSALFLRIHKSILLNGTYISKISATEVLCYDGRVFAISRALQELTKEKYEAFVNNNPFISIRG